MSVFFPLSAYFLAYAILEPEMGSEQHITLLLFAACLSIGISQYRNWVNRKLDK